MEQIIWDILQFLEWLDMTGQSKIHTDANSFLFNIHNYVSTSFGVRIITVTETALANYEGMELQIQTNVTYEDIAC